MKKIEQGIYYEDSFLGVTLGALTLPHGTIMIDAPLRIEDARSWRSSLINHRGGPNRLLVSLDAHPDRTLGIRALDCTVVVHQNTADVFQNRPTIFKGQELESGAIWETYGDAIGMRWSSPDITFSKRMSLHWGESPVILESQPGPTDGSIWVVIPDRRILFVGDAVLLNQPPFLAEANLDSWIMNLELLLSNYKNFIVVGGRNGIVSDADIRFQIRILKKVRKDLERLENRNAPPDKVETLVPGLLSNYSFSPELTELYTLRLRYGLYHYYMRSNQFGDGLEEEEFTRLG